MKKILLLLFIIPFFANGQCNYPASATSVGTYTFCIDNTNTLTTPTVAAGRYALVNVVQGFAYTFSVGNVFSVAPASEIISVYDASNNAGLISSTGVNGASVTNWTATLSGQVKVLLSRGGSAPSACTNDGSAGGALTLTLNNVGNTQDSQTVFGTNQWVGHVYNWTGGVPPGGASPSSPSSTTPFSNAQYVGYYNILTETINESFGGNTNCFNVLSDGVNRTNIHTERFAVRYRMKSTRAAGCYFLNVNGDDGVRVYVDNVLVFNQWKEQGDTPYCNNLIYLNGNSDIILDYYENAGGNVIGFSLTPYDGSSNTILSSTNVVVCSGASPGTINASAIASTCSGRTNTIYQWQVSNDNITFNDIAGANSEDYTPPMTSPAVSTVTYYKRVLKPFVANAGTCNFDSAVIMIRVNPIATLVLTSGTSNQTVCAGTAITPTVYTWGGSATDVTVSGLPSGLTATKNAGAKTVTISGTATATGTYSVVTTGQASPCTAISLGGTITVNPIATLLLTSGTANQTVCAGTDITSTVYTWGGSATDVTVSNLPSGLTATKNTVAKTVTITGMPTATGTYNIATIGQTAPCTVISLGGTITLNPILTNNDLSFANGNSGQASATPAENDNAILTTPAGTYFSTVNFASYGTPTGTAPNFVIGSCTASTSRSVVETLLLGNGTTSIPATNAVFGDPCNGTLKRLYVLASYVEPLCSGASAVLNGTTPTGGTGLYTYLWESSTTSPTTGFSAAVGTNNLINYTSGALTQTTYFRRAVSSCSYSNTSEVIMVRVNPVISGNTVPASQTICSGSAPTTLIASTPTGGSGTFTYTWQSSTTSATAGFTTATGTSNAKDYSPGVLSTSTWFRRVVNSGTCVDTSAVTLITTTTTAVPTIGTVTQPTCATPTGSIVLNGLPGSGTWTLTRSGTSTATITIMGTGSTATISGLTADSYSFTVSVSSCVSASTASIPINALTTTTYNGTIWSTAPTLNMNGVISTSGTIANDVDLCSCTVNTGVTAIVAQGVMMRLQNELTVTGTGSLTFSDDSSLVQINDAASNSGSIFYQRVTTPISNFDYTYWSAPVAGQKLIDFSPNTLGDKFLSFDSSINNWKFENAYTTFMSKGTGYIIRGPQSQMAPLPPSPVSYQFTGAPHNGIVSVAIGAANNSVLAGNPYPSALDADSFILANTGITPLGTGKISGTLYFWTHNTSIRLASTLAAGTAGSGSFAYTSDDYASYNITGGVGTASKSSTNPGAINDYIPSGKIAAGQSFFTSSALAGNVVFNNSMRVGVGSNVGNNSQFFKTASSGKSNGVIEKSRVWLDLYNTEGAYKQLLVGYITGATNNYDNIFDGITYNANAFLDFYSINKGNKLAIQGRELPFDITDEVPIGFSSKIDSNYKIAIGQVDGLLLEKNILLKDKELNVVHDLSKGPYSFTTAKGVFDERFVILYTNKTLSVDEVEPITQGLLISTKNKSIAIQSSEETIADAYVYDIAGKQLFAKKAINANKMVISNLAATNVVLLVKVVLTNGSEVTQKIVY
jgi:hypothetical protein